MSRSVELKYHLDYDQFTAVTISFTLGLAQVYNISYHCFVAILELLTSQSRMCHHHKSERAAIKQSYFPVAVAIILFCPGFVYVTYYRIL